MNWRVACMVPLYKKTVKKRPTLQLVLGKMYANVLINRMMELTEHEIGEEQCFPGNDISCSDEISVSRQLREKLNINMI